MVTLFKRVAASLKLEWKRTVFQWLIRASAVSKI